MLVFIHLLEVRQELADQFIEVYFDGIGKLLVIDARKEQQRLVHLDDASQGMVDTGYFEELFFRTIGVLAEEFQLVHADSQRRLQFMGSILDELFLLVVHLRTALDGCLDGFVEDSELIDFRLVHQGRMLFP